MHWALVRCAALISLTSFTSAEEQEYSIEEMLNNEVKKSKRTDIAIVSNASGFAKHGGFAKASSIYRGHMSTRFSDDSGTDSTGADAITSILEMGSDSSKPADDIVKDWNGQSVDLSDSSRQIVSGMIEAFMHRVTLEPGEKRCLENSVGTFASSMVQAGKDAVDAIKDLIKGNESNPVGILPLLMDAGVRVSDMVAMGTQLAKNCVQGDALALLNQTGRNIMNMTYIKRRFIVSGVDVAQALSDCIVSFEEHEFHKFGADIGTALRKILLSTSNTGRVGVPEGVPEERIIEQVTEGLSRGFFANGMNVIVTDKVDPRVHINIDLHKCIAGNHELFKEVWAGAWTFFAMIAANKEQHGLASLFGSQAGQGQPEWASELFSAMLQVPLALERCGFGVEMQTMLGEAIKSLNELSFNMTMPKEKVKADVATEKMALAVEAWTNWHFLDFGMEIGKLLRELVLLIFPKMYSVDASGQLQRNLIEDVAIDSKAFPPASHTPLFIVGGVMLVMMMSLVALKTIRAVTRLQGAGALATDLEKAARQDECDCAE